MTGAAERLLAEVRGGPVTVAARELLAAGRGRVERLTVDPPAPGARGAFVIAKGRALDEWSESALATEHAALTAVEHAGLDIAPRVLAGSAGAGVLVMTDVGRRAVEDLLLHGEAAEAEAAVVALAEAAAALHRVPVGEPLVAGPAWTVGSAFEPDLLAAALDGTGFPPLGAASADAADVATALAAPGRFAALAHGDLVPANAVVGDDGRCRLVDFEGAGLQHVGVDACMLRFPFAWYGRWALLPPGVRDAMELAYRQAVDRPARDVDVAIAVGCAAMCLLRLQRLPRIAADDQPPEQAYRRRVQIASTVEVGAAALSDAGMLPALAAWLGDVLDVARSRWREATLPPPIFPAFR